LQRLQQLQQLQRLTILNKSYQEVDILQRDEDVIIYCDPPYRNTEGYKIGFDYKQFDEWVKKQDKTIFISEYDTPFNEIFSIEKRVLLSASNNKLVKTEKLYCNKELETVQEYNLFNEVV
jgi:DNA adenine methylase